MIGDLSRKDSIRATFDIFKSAEDSTIEVRAMDKYTFSGYYRSKEKLVNDILERDNQTWYFVFNDIDPACYSREQSERIISQKGIKTTGDKEITAIRWILIDLDPVRPSGVSSTDDEKLAACQKMQKVYTYLRGVGFSEPVICDSGNGYHLLYSVALKTENSIKIKSMLIALDMLFSDDAVAIDTSVFNPARITKVYGTMARKGANTEERPWRTSKIMFVPDDIKTTPLALIEKVASVIPQEPSAPNYKNSYESFDIDKFIQENGIIASRDIVSGGVRKIVLEECPFDHSHKAPDSAIFVMPNGSIAFKCFHNSCSDKTWRDLRSMYDPDCYKRSLSQTRTNTPANNKDAHRAPQAPHSEREEEQNIRHAETLSQPVQQKREPPHFLRLCDIETRDRSQIVSIKTGFTELDKKIIGLNKGELSIWSGGNGSGKSTLLSQMCVNAIDAGYNCVIFSGELTKNRTKDWIELQIAGRQNTRLSQNGVCYYVPRKESAMISAWAADKLWIYNNEVGLNVGQVVGDIREHVRTHKTDMVVIDNLMSLDLSTMQGEKYDKQTQLVLLLSRLCKELNVHINFVCHPRKPNGFLRKSDISGTADIANAADNVFMMSRIDYDFLRTGKEFFGVDKVNKMKDYTNVIEIMKNRDLGVQDEFVGLYFEKESKRLLNVPHENRVYGWESTSCGSYVPTEVEEAIGGLPE